jgi:pyruvate ferredoxin oxidoreductase gamma subunit
VAAKFLADAAARSGFHAQSFASYGALRRGGKVESYVRISESRVRPHCKLYEPDWVVLMDASFAEDQEAQSGLKVNGQVLINSRRPAKAFPTLGRFRVHTVDASSIAEREGLVLPGGMPVINTTMLGALVRLLESVELEDMKQVIQSGTPRPEKNIQCAERGFRQVISQEADSQTDVETDPSTLSTLSSLDKYPRYHQEKMRKCHRCQICYMVCPNLAIGFQEAPFTLHVNKNFCTRCGICLEECPRGAISWGEVDHD